MPKALLRVSNQREFFEADQKDAPADAKTIVVDAAGVARIDITGAHYDVHVIAGEVTAGAIERRVWVWDRAHLVAYGTTCVVARDDAMVEIYDRAHCTAMDRAHVTAHGQSFLALRERACGSYHGQAYGQADDHATARMWGPDTAITATGFSTVSVRGGARVSLNRNAVAHIYEYKSVGDDAGVRLMVPDMSDAQAYIYAPLTRGAVAEISANELHVFEVDRFHNGA